MAYSGTQMRNTVRHIARGSRVGVEGDKLPIEIHIVFPVISHLSVACGLVKQCHVHTALITGGILNKNRETSSVTFDHKIADTISVPSIMTSIPCRLNTITERIKNFILASLGLKMFESMKCGTPLFQRFAPVYAFYTVKIKLMDKAYVTI
jgi:hypothetical protein